MPHVVIIGGGIAGLSTAYYLQQRAAGAVDYTLIEGQDRFGGTIVTRHVEGFTIEGGPDSYITQKPWGLRLCRELGLGERLLPANEGRRVFVVRQGRLVQVPAGFRLTVPTNFRALLGSRLFSPLGKLRIMCEPLIPVRRDNSDESIASFVGRRVGAEALERLAGPIMAGIYVSTPQRLSMRSTFPMFIDLVRKYRSLILGMIAARRKRQASTRTPSFGSVFASLAGGMGELVERLTSKLTGDLRLGATATGLTAKDGQWQVQLANNETLAADAVVLAIPSHVASRLVAAQRPDLAERLDSIEYVSSATVSLAFRRDQVQAEHDFDGLGFLVPAAEGRRVLACTWSSTKFDGRAPADGVLVRAFLGGERHEEVVDLTDDAIVALAREELGQLMGLTGEPVVTQVFRWPKTNPQYDVGHMERVAEMEEMAAESPGLYLTGSAYRGVGIPGCIGNAVRTIDQLAEQFGLAPLDDKHDNQGN